MTPPFRHAERWTAFGFLALLAIAGAALMPGLDGMFMVDDYENLRGLQDIADDPGAFSALRYMTSGITGNLGRPLSLATFALQYASWPTDPSAFIGANIALHLFNACLLMGGLGAILALARPGRASNGPIALAAAWLWTFSALQTGAVLYVVQRMAELSGTCVLAGLWLYVAGRRREIEGRVRSGLLLMLLGAGVGTVLGVLAKESAALFPLMLLALEATLFAALPRSTQWRRLSWLVLWLPSALLAAYLASLVPSQLHGLSMREFTLGERLLSEPRVLFLYLGKFLLPPLYGIRLYYDDLAVSHSLLAPWTTLPALAGVLGLLAAAFAQRRRAPMFAFAVLWFAAAHLIESTVVPLELAFDHRNYVALLGPALGLAAGGAALLAWAPLARVRPALLAGIALYLAFFSFTCWQSARFWGQPWELMSYWARTQPDSRRAYHGEVQFYWGAAQPEKAAATLDRALARWPGDVSFLLGKFEQGCLFPDQPVPPLEAILPAVAQFDSTAPASVGTLDVILTSTEMGLCSRYTPTELWAMTQMLFEAAPLKDYVRVRLQILARIAALAHDAPVARSLLDQALRIEPSASGYERALQWSLEAGDGGCARYYLQHLASPAVAKPMDRLIYRDRFTQFAERVARLPDAAPSAACQAPVP